MIVEIPVVVNDITARRLQTLLDAMHEKGFTEEQVMSRLAERCQRDFCATFGIILWDALTKAGIEVSSAEALQMSFDAEEVE